MMMPDQEGGPVGPAGRAGSVVPVASVGAVGSAELDEPGGVRKQAADYSWGDPVATASDAINEGVTSLQAELLGLVQDMAAGPIAALRDDAKAFLGELRREFLRHHRRLGVQTRPGTEMGASLTDLVHGELAELAERWRSVVLGRSARVGRSGWKPATLVEAIERAIAEVPETLRAPYEDTSYVSRSQDSVWIGLSRRWMRVRRRVNKREPPMRTVALQQLAAFHVLTNLDERLEGVAAVLVRADRHLASSTESLFSEVARGYEGLLGLAAGAPMVDALAALRDHVEQELVLAEREVQQIAEEAARRTTEMLSRSMRALKAELWTYGTFELPAYERDSARTASSRRRHLVDLTDRLQDFQDLGAATYAHIALGLEVEAFEARIKRAFDLEVKNLEQDVRGRTCVQLARVDAALSDALRRLEQRSSAGANAGIHPTASADGNGNASGSANPNANANASGNGNGNVRDGLEASTQSQADLPGPDKDIESRLRACLEPVERVVREAVAAVRRLLDQLGAEQALASLVDVLNREAEALTDRYRVPEAPYSISEWKLPDPPATADVQFRDIVVAYLQVDVGPRALKATSVVTEKVQGLLTRFEALERIVTFDVEMITVDLDDPGDRTHDLASPLHLREVLVSALARAHEDLQGLLAESEHWPAELTQAIRQAMLSRIAALQDRLASADVAKFRIDRSPAEAGRRIVRQVARLEKAMARGGRRAQSVVRQAVGDDRLATLRSVLGMGGAARRELTHADFSAPVRAKIVPVFYRRLFTPQAYWAGDVSQSYHLAIHNVVEALVGHPGATLRTGAVVAIDGVGRGAILSAIAREARWTAVRRFALTRPTDGEDLDDLLGDITQGNLVIISGVHWLLSAAPGGFEPLRHLVARMTADAGRNAWLLDMSSHVFRYACSVSPLAEVLSEAAEIRPLSQMELQMAIEARHSLSGYEVAFEGRDGEEKSVHQSLAARQTFFRALHLSSGGMLLVALAQWISSIVQVNEEAKLLVLGPPPESPKRALARLDDISLLILYQVARQGWMSNELLAQLFRWETVVSDARLSRLVNLGLLERQQNLFQVRFHLRGALHQIYVERGWL